MHGISRSQTCVRVVVVARFQPEVTKDRLASPGSPRAEVDLFQRLGDSARDAHEVVYILHFLQNYQVLAVAVMLSLICS